MIKIISFHDPEYKEEYAEGNYNNWWYLDGKLEELVGYDKASFYDTPGIFDEKGCSWIEGECKVEVKGINESCVGCFWISGYRQRGLVVLESDTEALRNARVSMRIGKCRL